MNQTRPLVNHRDIMVSRYHDMEVAMSDSQDTEKHGQPDRPKAFEIKIDRMTYRVNKLVLTGAELRQVPEPDIGMERDLFEVVPGGSDLKIEAETAVNIRNGLRFFTAPAQINPGQNWWAIADVASE